MCTTCGCSDKVHASVTDPETGETEALHALDGHHAHEHHHHDHAHGHEHHHGHHDHVHDHATTVALTRRSSPRTIGSRSATAAGSPAATFLRSIC